MIKEIKKYRYYQKINYDDIYYNIENEVFLKYQMKINKVFLKTTWEEILKENEFSYFDRISKNKLKKMMSEYEIKEYLINNNASIEIIEKLINKYKYYGFIDDKKYISIFIENKKSTKGKRLIKQMLLKKGLSLELIEKQLLMLNLHVEIDKLVAKELLKNKSKSKSRLKEEVIRKLVTKGFSVEEVVSSVNKQMLDYNVNEIPMIEKDLEKLLYKYRNKILRNELKYFIKNKLLEKGYKNLDINEVLEKQAF